PCRAERLPELGCRERRSHTVEEPAFEVRFVEKPPSGSRIYNADFLLGDPSNCRRAGSIVVVHQRQMKCQKETCREPLWQLTGELRRYEPARYIHKRMRRFFDYLIIHEAHEEKSAHS